MAHAFSMSLLILFRGVAQQNGTAQGYGSPIWGPDPRAPTNPDPPIPGEVYEQLYSLQDVHSLAHQLVAQ